MLVRKYLDFEAIYASHYDLFEPMRAVLIQWTGC